MNGRPAFLSMADKNRLLSTSTTMNTNTDDDDDVLSVLTAASSALVTLRGGASPKSRRRGGSGKAKTVTGMKKVGDGQAGEKSKKAVDVGSFLKDMPGLSRVYFMAVVGITLGSALLGAEMAQAIFAIDPLRTFSGFELWRPLTAACSLGPPSLSWLYIGYYMVKYGKALEEAHGTAQHLVFMAVQLVLLTFLSPVLGQPYICTPLVASILHVVSRRDPESSVNWQLFRVPFWAFPILLAIGDILQSQSISAAIPYAMGILTGHFYLFHKDIWTKQGGEDWLQSPDFLVRTFDPDAKDAKGALKSALRRKRGKGRKLSS